MHGARGWTICGRSCRQAVSINSCNQSADQQPVVLHSSNAPGIGGMLPRRLGLPSSHGRCVLRPICPRAELPLGRVRFFINVPLEGSFGIPLGTLFGGESELKDDGGANGDLVGVTGALHELDASNIEDAPSILNAEC